MEEILSFRPKKKIILLGNEAVVRGALEAGVDFVSTYPGTPASEIGNSFYLLKEKIKKINPNFHFEFSVNEKVAIESAAGASFSGATCLVAFKNFGLNVASDFFFPLAQIRLPGSLVILVADDPSCWSSAQSEQDTRHEIFAARLPLLEPSEPQESKEFTLFAFDISKKFQIPVVIRHTTRASHQSMPVRAGRIPKKRKEKFKFKKDPSKFITMPPRVLEMKLELIKRREEMRKISEKSSLNKIFNQNPKSKVGIITSGIGFCYVMESLNYLKLKIPVLKLGLVFPLPKNKIKKFLKDKEKILVVEEGDPFLEQKVKEVAFEAKFKGEIFGKEGSMEGGRIWKKRKAILPVAGELKPEYVLGAISKISKKNLNIDFEDHLKKFEKVPLPKRRPIFCTPLAVPGKPPCPYWAVFSAIKKATKGKEVIFGGEIGCYMMAGHPVVNLQDYLFCMGSSTGLGHGISKTSKQKVIAFVGDSSFFHAGIPALINTVFNKSNPLIIIFNNQTTAMTGHQPHPGSVGIEIEKIVRACGVKHVKTIDQVKDQKEFENTLREFLKKKETAVIIASHPCIFVQK